MEAKTDRLYSSAPLEKDVELEQRWEKNLNIINSFNNSVNNIKEKIQNFKDENNKSKKYRKYKTRTTIVKSFDTFVNIAKTLSSITLSFTGFDLIVISVTTGAACGLSIGNKVSYEIIINEYNKYKKLYEKDEQTIKSFDKFYRKSLQDNVIDKTEYESLCNIFTKFIDETKNELFFRIWT